MSVNLTTYNELKDKARTAKDAVSRAEGALEQHLKALKADFDCDTIEEAEKLLERMQNSHRELEEEAERLLGDFEEKWKEHLSK